MSVNGGTEFAFVVLGLLFIFSVGTWLHHVVRLCREGASHTGDTPVPTEMPLLKSGQGIAALQERGHFDRDLLTFL
jgi:hypothetical protein